MEKFTIYTVVGENYKQFTLNRMLDVNGNCLPFNERKLITHNDRIFGMILLLNEWEGKELKSCTRICI